MEIEFGEARQVLRRRVQHPLGSFQRFDQRIEPTAKGDRIDQHGSSAFPAQLHQVGTLRVAVARGSLGVHRDRTLRPGESRSCSPER
jgi:hypothetical protein